MQHVDVKINSPVATVLIRRPEVLGALDPVLIADLQTVLGDVHQETKVRAVILTGGGPYFSSGMDLRVMDRIARVGEREIPDVPDPAAMAQWFKWWQSWTSLLETMLRFPKPILAAVDGPAIGGGFALALASDIIVASDRARFAAAAPVQGVVGGATMALLQFRCGAAIAARYGMTAREIDAPTAHRLGLCDAPVTSDQIWVAAQSVGHEIARSTDAAIAASKRMLNETVGETLLSNLSVAAATDASICSTPAAEERFAAFANRT